MIGIAIIDSIATQLYLELFLGGFRVSLSVILLPIFLYYNPKVNPIVQAFYIMTIGLVMRSLFGLSLYGSLLDAFMMEYPTFIFDLSYGIIYYYFYTKSENANLSRWFTVILLNDFASNVLELLFRTKINSLGVFGDIPILLVIACVRAVSAITIVLIFKYYTSLLKRDEHDLRYKHLVMLTANLNSETYLMKRNMRHIESVMNEAYSLYETTQSENDDISNQALEIAKEVHEIKKNYIQVIDGLESVTGNAQEFEVMKLKDLYNILEHHGKLTAEHYKNVVLSVRCKSNFYVREHYLVMTILRNLLNNAMEAVSENSFGIVELDEFIHDEYCVMIVKDNGSGIRERNLDHIFEPGFSTKFNAITGDISRGVGLTLVWDIVTDKFKGTIEVESKVGLGTSFVIKIPRNQIEVKSHEIFYR